MTDFSKKTTMDLLADAGAILRDQAKGYSMRDMHLTVSDISDLVEEIATRLDAVGHTGRAEYLDEDEEGEE